MTKNIKVIPFVLLLVLIRLGDAEVNGVTLADFGDAYQSSAEAGGQLVQKNDVPAQLLKEPLPQQLAVADVPVVAQGNAEYVDSDPVVAAADATSDTGTDNALTQYTTYGPIRDTAYSQVEPTTPPFQQWVGQHVLPIQYADAAKQQVAPVFAAQSVAADRIAPQPILDAATPEPVEYGAPVDMDAVYANIYGIDTCCVGSPLCGCAPCGCRAWLRGDVLLWWLQGYDTPALVSTSPLGTDPAQIGLPGRSTPLFGAGRFGDDLRVGGRIRGGWWLDCDRRWGIDGEFFGVGGADDDFSMSSNGYPILARPFFNTNPSVYGPDAEILAARGIATGAIDYRSSSQIYSAAALLRANLCCCQGFHGCEPSSSRWDLLLGYRYFHLGESLSSFESFYPTGMFFMPGTFYELSDALETRNDFHGGEIGAHYQNQRGRWVLELAGRVALGQTTREVRVSGSSRAVVPGVMDRTVPGGFLTSGIQLGSHRDSEFGVLPQAEVTLGCYLTTKLRFNVGYNFLYLNNVVRPGRALPAIDSSTLLSGVGTTPIHIEDVDQGAWLQGVSLGLTWNF